MSSAPVEPPESEQPADTGETGAGAEPTAEFVVGRAALLAAGPVVLALLWAFGALPAWGAAALGGFLCVVALVFLARLRALGRDTQPAEGARVLVVGGGYAGLVAARALQARLPGGARGGRHLGGGGDVG